MTFTASPLYACVPSAFRNKPVKGLNVTAPAGVTLAVICCVPPVLQMITGDAGVKVIIGVCLITRPLKLETAVHPIASVVVNTKLLVPAGTLETVKFPVLPAGPVDGN